MKTLLTILIFFSVATFAQNNQTKNDSTLVHGIQFQLPNILSIGNFDGYTFAYRYKLNKNSGYRFGFTTNIRNNNSNSNELRDTLLYKTSLINENYFIKFSAQYIRSIMSYQNFSFIIGGGPSVLYRRKNNIIKHPQTRTANLFTSYGIGADFLAGVEYRLYKNIVISGEYGLDIVWKRNNIESKLTDNNYSLSNKTNTEREDSFDINNKHALLGIAIYF